MNVHFIAIGGSAMHNLAIALKRKGYNVTGSDDEIFEPSKGRLKKAEILPDQIGWSESNIHENLDAVILGMHARIDNPELLKAQSLGLSIYSYPEYLYEQGKDKERIVIGGSHGKTTITSMILHVLMENHRTFDYMVGAQLEGFDCMVKLTKEAKQVIYEGDEYLSSPIDRRPKFHLYQPHIALLSGIAWDHINVFPTWSNYVEQFEIFIDKIEDNGSLIYSEDDPTIVELVEKCKRPIKFFPYKTHEHSINDGITILHTPQGDLPIEIFGKHNLQNLNGARLVCQEMGLSQDQFYSAIQTFKGASKRLELVIKTDRSVVYKDFAHSPSKLKATVGALKNQYPQRKLVACMELHTFSSLNKEFLSQYEGCMKEADVAFVYYSPDVVAHKKLPPISKEEVKTAFNSNQVVVFTDSNEMMESLKKMTWEDANLLWMSSGNFHGISFKEASESLLLH